MPDSAPIRNSSRTSRYSAKRNSGRQMYGPGCCAHRVTATQILANRERVAERDRREGKRIYIAPIHWESQLNEESV